MLHKVDPSSWYLKCITEGAHTSFQVSPVSSEGRAKLQGTKTKTLAQPQKLTSSVFFLTLYSTRQDLSSNAQLTRFWLVWPASMAHGFQMSASRVLGSQATTVLPSFFVGHGDSSPHTLTASALSSDPFPFFLSCIT